MNWEEAFKDLYDQLFWYGFTGELKDEDPERWQFEFDTFLGTYQ